MMDELQIAQKNGNTIVNGSESTERYFFAKAFCYQKDVIDVGCKFGVGSFLVARHAKSLVATDIEDQFRFHSVIPFVQADFTAEEVPFGRQFEVAVCLEVIEHVDNPRQVIDNIAKILHPGGLLILSTPCVDRGLPLDVHITPYFSEEAFDSLLEKGFELKVKTRQLGVSWLAVAEKK